MIFYFVHFTNMAKPDRVKLVVSTSGSKHARTRADAGGAPFWKVVYFHPRIIPARQEPHSKIHGARWEQITPPQRVEHFKG